MLNIQYYTRYIITKRKLLPTIPSINIYINKINNRQAFRIKHKYQLELKTPEITKLFGSTKKLIEKTKNGENL